jgi:hypothetical protein
MAAAPAPLRGLVLVLASSVALFASPASAQLYKCPTTPLSNDFIPDDLRGSWTGPIPLPAFTGTSITTQLDHEFIIRASGSAGTVKVGAESSGGECM